MHDIFQYFLPDIWESPIPLYYLSCIIVASTYRFIHIVQFKKSNVVEIAFAVVELVDVGEGALVCFCF